MVHGLWSKMLPLFFSDMLSAQGSTLTDFCLGPQSERVESWVAHSRHVVMS
jgi:hypothetical protein